MCKNKEISIAPNNVYTYLLKNQFFAKYYTHAKDNMFTVPVCLRVFTVFQ